MDPHHTLGPHAHPTANHFALSSAHFGRPEPTLVRPHSRLTRVGPRSHPWLPGHVHDALIEVGLLLHLGRFELRLGGWRQGRSQPPGLDGVFDRLMRLGIPNTFRAPSDQNPTGWVVHASNSG